MPACAGMRFSTPMWRPGGMPVSVCRARAARTIRSSCGRASVRSSRVIWPSGRSFKVQRVAPVDQHEDRLQQVVAVGPPARDVQEQVELGRCRHVVQRLHCPHYRHRHMGRQAYRSRISFSSAAGAGSVRVAARRPWSNARQISPPPGAAGVHATKPVKQCANWQRCAGHVAGQGLHGIKHLRLLPDAQTGFAGGPAHGGEDTAQRACQGQFTLAGVSLELKCAKKDCGGSDARFRANRPLQI